MIKKLSVAVSYFHNKIGPIVYMSYPEDVLTKEEESRIADMLDQAFEEGMFTNKFGDLYSINYYFEIPSKWARGNKEMLMLSVVVDDAPNPENEEVIESWSDDFSTKLKTEEGIYQAFYKRDDIKFSDKEDERDNHYKNLRNWVEDFYCLVV